LDDSELITVSVLAVNDFAPVLDVISNQTMDEDTVLSIDLVQLYPVCNVFLVVLLLVLLFYL